MARKRRDLSEAEARSLADVEQDLERRYRWLGRWLMNAEPVGPAANIAERIRAKRDKLNASGKPIEDRLAALEQFLDELGVLDRADRFAGRFAQPIAPLRSRPRRARKKRSAA